MSDWSLTEIRSKVKKLCGDTNLDNDDLDEKINRIYRNVIPLEFILESLKVEFSQVCTAEDGEYPVDTDTYLKVGKPAELDDLESDNRVQLTFTTNRGTFFRRYPEIATEGDVSDTTGTPVTVLHSYGNIYPRPIPDDAYIIYLEAYKKPDALSDDDDAPVEQLWGPIIACDVAMEILIDTQDMEPTEGIQAERTFFVNKMINKEILMLEDFVTERKF